MATGPQRARLDQGLSGAHETVVQDSVAEWNRCARILQQISGALASASPQVKEEIGGQTGPAIDAAFARSSAGMTAKAGELTKGSAALQSAADAIADARSEQLALESQQVTQPPPYTAPVGPPTDKDIQEEAADRQAHAQYQAAFADQERRAKEKADHMDQVFARSSAVMKEIHGEPDPRPQGAGGAGGGGSAGGSGGLPPASHAAPPPISGGPGPYHPGPGGPGYVPGDGGALGGTPFDDSPGSPTPAGATSGSVTPASGGGLSGTAGLGLAGAAAGGIGGGLLGTGLAAGGIRGGLTPVVTSPGTAAGGVRGIGATGRSGVSGALGRPGGVGAVSAGTGTAASRGTTARGAGGRADSGAAGRGSAGGRGAAAAGSTVAGRPGRGKDDETGRKRELFDVAEDWVDDEDAAPGVLD